LFALLFLVALPGGAQRGSISPVSDPSKVRLPDGKLQIDEIAKADYQRTLKDASQLLELAEHLKQELEKDDSHVLSVSSLRKTEEIEKLARKIRARLKRF
jgi:hypothetical protein